MPINVYDTPGFDDSDKCQKAENQKLIASHITTPVDVFAYFLNADEDRLDQTIQNHFRLLQEWTFGNIWKNLLIVYNRVDRSHDKQEKRAMLDEGSIKNRFDKKLRDLKTFLWRNMTIENGWTRRNDDNSDELTAMKESDFKDIRYITLNVAQNRHCNLNSNGFIDADSNTNKFCWKQPNLDEYNDYITDYDWKIDSDDNNWVLVNDIQIFQNIIQEFSHHPVSTQTMFLRKQLKKDKDEYLKRHVKTEDEQAKADKIFERNKLDVSKCKSDYEKTTQGISDDNCPQWTEWQEGECSKECGVGNKTITRECHKQGKKTKNEDCRNEFVGQYDEITEICIVKQFCQWNNWGDWSPCSKQCGGETVRTRTCPHDHCAGSSKESKLCNERKSNNDKENAEISDCPYWSKWIESECSKQCGLGKKTKTRDCLKRGMKTESEDCLKEYDGQYSKINENCIIKQFCNWNSWDEWSQCTKPCGHGEKYRERTCSGDACPGSTKETKNCNQFTCVSDWAEWTDSGCSSQCGPGLRTFSRECTGEYCGQGSAVKQVNCNERPCPERDPDPVIIKRGDNGGSGFWEKVVATAVGAIIPAVVG